jgi:hypothetical protein
MKDMPFSLPISIIPGKIIPVGFKAKTFARGERWLKENGRR